MTTLLSTNRPHITTCLLAYLVDRLPLHANDKPNVILMDGYNGGPRGGGDLDQVPQGRLGVVAATDHVDSRAVVDLAAHLVHLAVRALAAVAIKGGLDAPAVNGADRLGAGI